MINLITALTYFLYGSSAFFWGANGHRVVAEICDYHLSEKAKIEVANILGKEYITEVTNWPDYVKAEKGWDFASSWHYTTIDLDESISEVRAEYAKDPAINDALEAMDLMINILKGDEVSSKFFEDLMTKNKANPLNGSVKATALAFLVHLVGDIHQPLHVGKNKDSGGNKISVLFFSEQTNSHSVWDTKIIEHERLSYTEFAHFINKLSPEEVASHQNATIDDWVRESITYREHIYNTLYDYTDRDTGLPSFSWQYQHDNIIIVKERLLQSGVRLAGILNEIYK